MKAPTKHRPRPFLSLRDAAFRLGDRLVFEGTSWTFFRHEQWAVTGANGSGKSLLADALRGRLPLVGGELNYHFRLPPGLVPEETIGHVSFEGRKADVHETVVQSRWNSLEEESALRVRDFLSYERVMEINPFEVGRSHEEPRRQFERRRRRAAALLRIEPFFERTLLTLSNGETQRVQLARALCHPLRLLILDEPFLGLDAATRAHFRSVLERLMRTSLRVLLITTRLEDLPRQVSHVLRVEGCRVVAAGPRSQILPSQPQPRPGAKPQPPLRSRAPRLPGSRTGTPLLELRHITVRYGATAILRDIHWTVRPGESWALLGHNGSGKTTLLSLILGDNPMAYVNDVVVFGRRRGEGDSIWELKKRIGWLSPELHLHFNDAITCFEAVASGFNDSIGLFEPPTPRQRKQARQCLKQFQLLEFAHTPLFALSAGLQRMVLLARALVKRPRLLILDEPCQGLDPAHRDHLVRAVDALIRAGSVTVIYVTHRPDEIPPSVTRALRLCAGKGILGYP